MTFFKKIKKNHKTVFIIFGLLNTTIIKIIMWFMKTTNLWIVISYYKCYIFIALLVYKPQYHIDIVGITLLYFVFSLFLLKFGTSVLYLELFYLNNYVWIIRYNNFANAWKISYYILKIIILGFVIVWTL